MRRGSQWTLAAMQAAASDVIYPGRAAVEARGTDTPTSCSRLKASRRRLGDYVLRCGRHQACPVHAKPKPRHPVMCLCRSGGGRCRASCQRPTAARGRSVTAFRPASLRRQHRAAVLRDRARAAFELFAAAPAKSRRPEPCAAIAPTVAGATACRNAEWERTGASEPRCRNERAARSTNWATSGIAELGQSWPNASVRFS